MAGSNRAGTITSCKEEEKRDGVAPRGRCRIDVKGAAEEGFPVTPHCTEVGFTLSRDDWRRFPQERTNQIRIGRGGEWEDMVYDESETIVVHR